MSRPNALEDEVRRFFSEYDRQWKALDVAQIISLWSDEDQPLYLGEEYADPLIGWDALREHLGRVETRVRAIDVTSQVHEVRLLATQVALALISTSWTVETVEVADRRSGAGWVTVLLRRRGAQWRLMLYAESPR